MSWAVYSRRFERRAAPASYSRYEGQRNAAREGMVPAYLADARADCEDYPAALVAARCGLGPHAVGLPGFPCPNTAAALNDTARHHRHAGDGGDNRNGEGNDANMLRLLPSPPPPAMPLLLVPLPPTLRAGAVARWAVGALPAGTAVASLEQALRPGPNAVRFHRVVLLVEEPRQSMAALLPLRRRLWTLLDKAALANRGGERGVSEDGRESERVMDSKRGMEDKRDAERESERKRRSKRVSKGASEREAQATPASEDERAEAGLAARREALHLWLFLYHWIEGVADAVVSVETLAATGASALCAAAALRHADCPLIAPRTEAALWREGILWGDVTAEGAGGSGLNTGEDSSDCAWSWAALGALSPAAAGSAWRAAQHLSYVPPGNASLWVDGLPRRCRGLVSPPWP